jgi:hypothetical protein
VHADTRSMGRLASVVAGAKLLSQKPALGHCLITPLPPATGALSLSGTADVRRRTVDPAKPLGQVTIEGRSSHQESLP